MGERWPFSVGIARRGAVDRDEVFTDAAATLRLTAAGVSLPSLLYYCSSFRGYSSLIPSATPRTAASSPPCSPSLSRQIRRITIHPPVASRERLRPRPGEESSRSISLRLDASIERGRHGVGSAGTMLIQIRWTSTTSRSKCTATRS